MTGRRIGDRFGGEVDDGQCRGREENCGALGEHTRDFAEHARRGNAGVEKGAKHPSDQGHIGGGGDAVSGDVADDYREL